MENHDCPNLGRVMGGWYRPFRALQMQDRAVTCRLLRPDHGEHSRRIKGGRDNVSIGGCKIELFDKDNYKE
jgi:hypothetical protein